MKSDGGPHVAIVGAGFSGTMVAVHLLRLGVAVTLIDKSGRYGRGLAYATSEAVHLLNVPAGKMSAFPDAPDHFVGWLGEGGDAQTFVPRMTYRSYLADILRSARGDLDCLDDEAVAIEGARLRLASGTSLDADAVVVAAGNLPPEPFAMLAGSALRFVNDPWSAEGRAAIAMLAGQEEDVLVLGSGLTMVDTVLTLDAHGFRGRIVALSRRGLLPRPHAPAATIAVTPPPSLRLRSLVRWARAQSRLGEWRTVIDSLRPVTTAIWQGWSRAERSRFLRHARPWWDVHRHRIAPGVWGRLQVLIDEGRLSVRAGRIAGIEGGTPSVRRRGAVGDEALQVAGVVNCTGPQGDIRMSGNPLIRNLLTSGAARADALGLGLDVDTECRVLAPDGTETPGLYAIGPMTRGVFWEMVAVPDIRGQAAALASRITTDLADIAFEATGARRAAS